ncbi:MAG: hypothetical protein E6J41_02060 [Chloroflexi bacterium]|nr:MAG: hypothetical protein E6J41_02060 [Chloroflexota bacterium]
MNLAHDSAAALPFTVRIDAAELRHAMRVRGLTGAELSRKAAELGCKVSQATVSHALNGRRIHPNTLRAINAVLRAVAPLSDVEALVARDRVVIGPGIQWGSRS